MLLLGFAIYSKEPMDQRAENWEKVMTKTHKTKKRDSRILNKNKGQSVLVSPWG